MLLTYFTVIDKQKGRNIFNPYPTIPPIDRKRKKNQACCNCCFTKTGFIIFGEIIMPCTSCIQVYMDPVFILLGIGVGLVFILLGFTVYFFLSCIQNDRILEPELAAENIYINAKSGNINSKTSSSPGPITASSPGPSAPPSPGVDLNYYPVSGQGRRRRQAGEAAGDRYDRHGRALAPSCIYPLLALVSTAAMCFISILVILCYLSNVVNP